MADEKVFTDPVLPPIDPEFEADKNLTLEEVKELQSKIKKDLAANKLMVKENTTAEKERSAESIAQQDLSNRDIIVIKKEDLREK
jgi:hypothetical protein